jgi:hypothetical protein
MDFAFKKLQQSAEESTGESDIIAYVQEKKQVMRSSTQFVETAREIRKKEGESFKVLREEMKKSNKTQDPIFSQWEKYMKGR